MFINPHQYNDMSNKGIIQTRVVFQENLVVGFLETITLVSWEYNEVKKDTNYYFTDNDELITRMVESWIIYDQ